MIYLVGLILLVLLFGAAAVKNAVALIAWFFIFMAFLVWLSVKTGISAGVLLLLGAGGLVVVSLLVLLAIHANERWDVNVVKRDQQERWRLEAAERAAKRQASPIGENVAATEVSPDRKGGREKDRPWWKGPRQWS